MPVDSSTGVVQHVITGYGYMISPDAIQAQAVRLFPKAVEAWLTGELEAFFPRRLRGKLRPSEDHAAAIAEVNALRSGSKDSIGYGYSIRWQTRRSHIYGRNPFPESISIETLEDLIRLCDKQDEWRRLQSAVACLRRRQPSLDAWLIESGHWKKLLALSDELDALLSLVDYFVANPRPRVFAREIPLPIPTKLLERHRIQLAVWLDRLLPPHTIDFRYDHKDFEPRYGLRYAHPHYLLRVLDRTLQAELGLPFDELSLPAESLVRLPVRHTHILLVENKTTLLSLPERHRGIALGGLGDAVTQLADIPWLKTERVTYWGDLDADAFEPLDSLRKYLPELPSLRMDESTLLEFQHLATKVKPVAEKPLAHLTETERRAYASVCEQGLRIEQEHLPMPSEF